VFNHPVVPVVHPNATDAVEEVHGTGEDLACRLSASYCCESELLNGGGEMGGDVVDFEGWEEEKEEERRKRSEGREVTWKGLASIVEKFVMQCA